MHSPSRLSALALLIASAPTWAQGAWPGGSAMEVGRQGQPGFLPASFEPSGAVWHPRRETLVLVSDAGQIAELTPGVGVTLWTVPGDLEAVTIVDPATDVVHVGIENPDGVMTFDLTTGSTGTQWDLTPWMTGPGNQGLEALAYIDGEFWAGLQDTGEIFRFRLLAGGAVQLLGSQLSQGGRSDLSGMHYDAASGVLYAIHDRSDVIVEYEPPGTFAREFVLPQDNQEGIALVGAIAAETEIYVAQDDGPVMRYATYPIEPQGTLAVENGSNANPLCLSSAAPPAIGTLWMAQINASGHPGATTSAVLAAQAPANGIFLPIGELLIDLGSPLFFTNIVPIAGVNTPHGIPVPADPSLVGFGVFLQGLTAAGSLRLCNRLDVTLGF